MMRIMILLYSFLLFISCGRQNSSSATTESLNSQHPHNAALNNGDECIDAELLSAHELLYQGITDPKTVEYLLLDDNTEGIEKYSGGESMLRYIPLPDKGDISVILTPQDQGDFDYRYYLLTIKHNKIVSGIYVEGEWYEPGSNEIEKTQFSIDKNYLITVVSIYEGEETVANYKIKDSGKLEETEN